MKHGSLLGKWGGLTGIITCLAPQCKVCFISIMWINSLTTSICSNTGGPRITDGDLEYSSSLS